MKIIELARKNIIKANSWVWSQDEQSYWIKFSECPRFQDLDIQYHGNHSANTPSVSYSSVLRAQRGQGQQNQQQHNRPHKQHFAGSSPRHQLTVSSSLNGLDSVGGKKRHTRQKKHKKKTGATTTTTTTPAVAAAAVAAPAPSKASQETEDSFDFSSWQKSIENAQIENELERANSELHKAAEQLGSKDIKLKEYKVGTMKQTRMSDTNKYTNTFPLYSSHFFSVSVSLSLCVSSFHPPPRLDLTLTTHLDVYIHVNLPFMYTSHRTQRNRAK